MLVCSTKSGSRSFSCISSSRCRFFLFVGRSKTKHFLVGKKSRMHSRGRLNFWTSLGSPRGKKLEIGCQLQFPYKSPNFSLGLVQERKVDTRPHMWWSQSSTIPSSCFLKRRTKMQGQMTCFIKHAAWPLESP